MCYEVYSTCEKPGCTHPTAIGLPIRCAQSIHLNEGRICKAVKRYHETKGVCNTCQFATEDPKERIARNENIFCEVEAMVKADQEAKAQATAEALYGARRGRYEFLQLLEERKRADRALKARIANAVSPPDIYDPKYIQQQKDKQKAAAEAASGKDTVKHREDHEDETPQQSKRDKKGKKKVVFSESVKDS